MLNDAQVFSRVFILFCGRRTDRLKGLVWEGDGFLLLCKRLNAGRFSWPRTAAEAMEITPEQYGMFFCFGRFEFLLSTGI